MDGLRGGKDVCARGGRGEAVLGPRRGRWWPRRDLIERRARVAAVNVCANPGRGDESLRCRLLLRIVLFCRAERDRLGLVRA